MSPHHSPEIAHALEIATNAHRHEPQARLHAFITLKVARGQSVNTETLPVVQHCPAPAPQKAPDPDMPTTPAEAPCQLKPEVRARVLRRCAQLGIVPLSLRGPEGAA